MKQLKMEPNDVRATIQRIWERRSLQDTGSQHSYETFNFKYLSCFSLNEKNNALICSPATSKIYHVTELKIKLDGTKCDPDNRCFFTVMCEVPSE